MGLLTQATKDAEIALKKARAEMHERNLKQMAELAKLMPTPTIEEVQKSLAGRAPVPTVTPGPPVAVPEPPVPQGEPHPHAEHRASEAEHDAAHKGGYKTRQTKKDD